MVFVNESLLPVAAAAGVAVGLLIAFIIAIIISVVLALYIYFSIAWMTIGNKLKFEHSYLAWIPFGRTAMILSMGELHWALTFLYLIPILGWIAIYILLLIAKWRIYEERKHPGWLSLLILLPGVGLIAHAVIVGIVAWDDKKK